MAQAILAQPSPGAGGRAGRGKEGKEECTLGLYGLSSSHCDINHRLSAASSSSSSYPMRAGKEKPISATHETTAQSHPSLLRNHFLSSPA